MKKFVADAMQELAFIVEHGCDKFVHVLLKLYQFCLSFITILIVVVMMIGLVISIVYLVKSFLDGDDVKVLYYLTTTTIILVGNYFNLKER